MNKLEVVNHFFKEVWTNERTDVIHQVFVPDGDDANTADGLRKGEKMSPQDFEMFHQALTSLIRDIVITVEDAIESGDWIASRCILHAKDRKTQEPVQMIGCAWARITDEKIREAHNYFDFMHLFEGLSLLPEDVMQRCLSGEAALK